MKPIIEIQLGGLLVRDRPDGSHMQILAKVNREDLRQIRDAGWLIAKPEKYRHIKGLVGAIRDYESQAKLPFADF